jgi:hypothetical protein
MGDLILQFPDEGRQGSEVWRLIAAQGDEGDVLAAGPLDRPAADDSAGVGKQDEFEQDCRRVGRRAQGKRVRGKKGQFFTL